MAPLLRPPHFTERARGTLVVIMSHDPSGGDGSASEDLHRPRSQSSARLTHISTSMIQKGGNHGCTGTRAHIVHLRRLARYGTARSLGDAIARRATRRRTTLSGAKGWRRVPGTAWWA